MKISEEDLLIVTRMAAAAYHPKEVAHAIGVDVEDFLKCLMDNQHPININYYKGFYSSQLAIRESVFKLARDGSSPAQTTALKLLDETQKKLLVYEQYNQ